MRRDVLAWCAAAVASVAILSLPLVAFGATTSVSIKDFAFQPGTIAVHAGDTVTWTNLDGSTHTATSVGAWDTGNLASGSSRSITFTTPGTYLYYCIYHSIMFGAVFVVPADEALPATAPTLPPAALRGPEGRPLIVVNTEIAPTLVPASLPSGPGRDGPNTAWLAAAVFVTGVAALAWRLARLSHVR